MKVNCWLWIVWIIFFTLKTSNWCCLLLAFEVRKLNNKKSSKYYYISFYIKKNLLSGFYINLIKVIMNVKYFYCISKFEMGFYDNLHHSSVIFIFMDILLKQTNNNSFQFVINIFDVFLHLSELFLDVAHHSRLLSFALLHLFFFLDLAFHLSYYLVNFIFVWVSSTTISIESINKFFLY